MAKEKRRTTKAISWSTVRKIAMALPDTEESTSYGTPAIKVKGRLFVRLREEKDVIVVRIEMSARAMRMEVDPDAFFVTDHYVAYPYMLIRLSKVSLGDLKELIRDAWEIVAA